MRIGVPITDALWKLIEDAIKAPTDATKLQTKVRGRQGTGVLMTNKSIFFLSWALPLLVACHGIATAASGVPTVAKSSTSTSPAPSPAPTPAPAPAPISDRYVFHQTETAQPAEVMGFQGSFGGAPTLGFAYISGNEASLSPQQILTNITASSTYVAAQVPLNAPSGLYAVWVKGTQSGAAPVFVNRARGTHLEFDEVAAGDRFRVFGRNLSRSGATPTARLVDASGNSLVTSIDVASSDAYGLTLIAPPGITPGNTYTVYVSNGAGGRYGEVPVEQSVRARASGSDPLGLGVPWARDYAFVQNLGATYNVMTDSRLSLHAHGDGTHNDHQEIQNAINLASSNGGGIVYLPSGTYWVDLPAGTNGNPIVMQPNVVIQGAGQSLTKILYGTSSTVSTYTAIVWNSGANKTAVVDLTIQNNGAGGLWQHPDINAQGNQ